jgi:hypothetical protein
MFKKYQVNSIVTIALNEKVRLPTNISSHAVGVMLRFSDTLLGSRESFAALLALSSSTTVFVDFLLDTRN